jgi:hypothetical protein
MENNRTEKGKFLPGNTGRPKGATNKTTREIKERVEWMLELADERIEESIAKLRPKELVDLAVSLQEYVRPKLQRMNLDMTSKDEEITKITFEVVPSARHSEGQSPPTPKNGGV